ncbi:class II fumarate hydratase [Methylacidimicrobium tartarophylax]|uniref:Fumarate hydratase class II n=1 Tax=Methylacidimicrobium tartarophylax TaxID=1041768 RepID=A0A5E6M6M6_9BACT|nr:class II fumarate hydratase [Methylacidimicrobium tartarophylax]VVM05209.1 fumarate hydratase, class II [Methylacidimicrobium tartarophylax]
MNSGIENPAEGLVGHETVTRQETDSMGSISIPADCYYGAQTARSLIHFSIGSERMPLEVIRALALLKKAAALVNRELGVLSGEKAGWIAAAADEILAGRFDHEFPLRVWQTGSGTQSNMNCNEVIAGRANELAGRERGGKVPIHPNDDVNRSQSSNDAFPSAMHLAVALALHQKFHPELDKMVDCLRRRSQEFAGIIKIGRTHLMDAVPLTLGQEFGGYVGQLELTLADLRDRMAPLLGLAIGGTAVGTGLNAPAGFGERVSAKLAEWTGLPFFSAPNKFAALASHEPLLSVSSSLRNLAASLLKLANDIRWMGSGPRCGLAELLLPENEPGSSIMPGKVNPTQSEALAMVCIQVMGADAAVGFAGSQGNFELNVFKPMIVFNVLNSIRLLGDSCRFFRTYCLEGLRPNLEVLRSEVERSLMLVTALTPRLGYDRSAKIAQQAYREHKTIREVCVSDGHLSAQEFDALVRPEEMVGDGWQG